MRIALRILSTILLPIWIEGMETAHAQILSTTPSQSLSDPAVIQRDRQRSQQLSPDDRARAIKLFDQAFALYQAGDFDSAKLGFERGLGIDPANGLANYYLGDLLVSTVTDLDGVSCGCGHAA